LVALQEYESIACGSPHLHIDNNVASAQVVEVVSLPKELNDVITAGLVRQAPQFDTPTVVLVSDVATHEFVGLVGGI